MAGLLVRAIGREPWEDAATRLLLRKTRRAIGFARQGEARRAYDPSSSDTIMGAIRGRVRSCRLTNGQMGVQVVCYSSPEPLKRIWAILKQEGDFRSTGKEPVGQGLSSPPSFILEFTVPTS